MDTDIPIDADNNHSTDRQVHELSPQESTGPRHRFQSIIDEFGLIPPKISRKQRAKDYVNNQWREFSFIDLLNAFLNKLPIIRCIKDYKLKQYAFGDLIAGVTVAVMHIPQGMLFFPWHVFEVTLVYCSIDTLRRTKLHRKKKHRTPSTLVESI